VQNARRPMSAASGFVPRREEQGSLFVRRAAMLCAGWEGFSVAMACTVQATHRVRSAKERKQLVMNRMSVGGD